MSKILEEENKLQNKFSDEDKNPAKLGYIEIYSSNLATRGLFYKEGFRIFIRAANVKEVKHWSTINEQDPIAVDEALNYILSNCVEVHLGPKMFGSYKDICQEDRFQIILSIRDLTYTESESKISVEAKCNSESCTEEKIKIDLSSNVIKTFNVSEDLMKRYSNDDKCFILKTKSFGDIQLKSPTIGLVSLATKIVKDSRESGKKIDTSFVSILPYLVHKIPTKDELKKIELDFLNWEPKKLSFYISLIKDLKFLSQSDGNIDLISNCEKCGSEVSTRLTFPNGIKSLFIVQDWASELL